MMNAGVPYGPVRCECGAANDEPCCWAAFAEDMVDVEILQDADSRADVARASLDRIYIWPEKYVRRLRVTRACAELLIARDGSWARRCT